MNKPARPILRLPDRQAKVEEFLSEPDGAVVPEAQPGRKGHVVLADGSVRRRLVCAVSPDIGEALETLRRDTGAPVSFHVERILRDGLGLSG